jgi:hypothetical protein
MVAEAFDRKTRWAINVVNEVHFGTIIRTWQNCVSLLI